MRRLPRVTTGTLARIAPWRIAAAALGIVLVLAAVALPREVAGSAGEISLATAISFDAVAVRLPNDWLAAGPPQLVDGDRIDIFGAPPQTGGPGVVLVLSEARVVQVASDGVVLEVPADDAATLALARSSGYLLLLALRPAP